MSDRMLDAIIFVESPPEIELRDGLFFLRFQFGTSAQIERVMLPSTFAKFMWRGQQALALFRSGANVVQLGPKVPDEEIPAAHG